MSKGALAKQSPFVILTISKYYSHPLIHAQINHLQLLSAPPGLATTTMQRPANAQPGLIAILKHRFLIKLETCASLLTLSLRLTVPTRTCTSTLLHDSARPSLYAPPAKSKSVTLASNKPTVTNPSTQLQFLESETTSTQVIPHVLVATVSALKIDAPIVTSSLKLKGGSLSQINRATKHYSERMTPLLGQQDSIPNGMTCTKSASAFMILLAAGELGEYKKILQCSTTALSRTADYGTKNRLPIYKACLFVFQVRLRSMKLPKLESNILSPEPQLTGVSAFKLMLVQVSKDPLFLIRTAIWTE